MSLRRRLVLGTSAAVAATVLLGSLIVYVSVRSTLRGQVDGALRGLVSDVRTVVTGVSAPVPGSVPQGGDAGRTVIVPMAPLGGPSGYAQIVTAGGQVLRQQGATFGLPVSRSTREVADGKRAAFFSDKQVDGVHVRVYTTRDPVGNVVQVARPLTDVDASLRRLLLVLGLVSMGGVAAAGGVGFAVSRAALSPVKRLTETAEHVAETQDLSRRLPVDASGDELARLGASFNTMLAALESSRGAQRQLVADASHELRTPLTSIRTNVEALARAPDLPAAEREAIVASARSQLEDLSELVGDLVDLARPAGVGEPEEDVRLDLLVEDAVERARRHHPGCEFRLAAEPAIVTGTPARLHRAITNLLDNAAKHGPAVGPVEVRVAAGGDGVEVHVDDHGPGIAPAERARVFDRFWRAPSARGLPGAGLGLAIVRQVADAHGGTVSVGEVPGGGARMRLCLPEAAPTRL